MSEVISRRRLLGFLGVAVVALAAPVVVSEEAEAQTGRHGTSTQAPDGAPPGVAACGVWAAVVRAQPGARCGTDLCSVWRSWGGCPPPLSSGRRCVGNCS